VFQLPRVRSSHLAVHGPAEVSDLLSFGAQGAVLFAATLLCISSASCVKRSCPLFSLAAGGGKDGKGDGLHHGVPAGGR
jgi:hypothetical protein